MGILAGVLQLARQFCTSGLIVNQQIDATINRLQKKKGRKEKVTYVTTEIEHHSESFRDA